SESEGPRRIELQRLQTLRFAQDELALPPTAGGRPDTQGSPILSSRGGRPAPPGADVAIHRQVGPAQAGQPAPSAASAWTAALPAVARSDGRGKRRLLMNFDSPSSSRGCAAPVAIHREVQLAPQNGLPRRPCGLLAMTGVGACRGASSRTVPP